ncbi:MAG: hypothetical protein NDI90_15585 [Nitrospira sp. BO4]|jgi:hypothetical protein|nr:hypothetical protein [Nitrospira sp. BO4]
MNIASFLPAVLAAPVPFVTEIMTVLAALAATTPDLAPGQGDILVSDARARLPFSASHTSNFLNHLEALSDPTLQAQVVAILLRLRSPIMGNLKPAGQDFYAAIWEQRQGPAWEARQGMSSAQYQLTFDDLVAQGFRLMRVSGYGTT